MTRNRRGQEGGGPFVVRGSQVVSKEATGATLAEAWAAFRKAHPSTRPSDWERGEDCGFIDGVCESCGGPILENERREFDDDGNYWHIPICPPRDHVANVFKEANAHLIAAAPTLYEVLEALLRDVDAINDDDALLVAANRSGWGDRVTPTMQQARAALALARGESPSSESAS